MSAKRYHMTADEIAFIRHNRATMGIAELARALGRAEMSIRNKCAQLGFPAQDIDKPTPEQVEFVKANYVNMTQPQLAEKIGRSVSSVGRMIRRLGLSGTAPRRNLVPAEIRQFIADHYERMTDAELAEKLEKSVIAVQAVRQRMGLKRPQVKPPKPEKKATPPGVCKMVRDQTRALRNVDNRPLDAAQRGADYLASFDRTPVFRIDEHGNPSTKGKLWRYGTARLSTEEMMAKAYRKGFDPDAWRRLAA